MSTDQRSIDWYNSHAESYTAHLRDPKDSEYHSLYEKPAMYALLPDIKDRVVLSLGCASGEDSNYLKAQGAKNSIGIDISSELIEIARRSYPECEFHLMDMEKLNFEDSSIDFAYSSLAIHYIEDWSTVFGEVYRVLKPGSAFLFSCGHPVSSAMEVTEDTESRRVKQLAVLSDKSTKTVEIIGSYLTRRKINGIADMAVTTWHKPIGEIASECTKAGFLIENFVEPYPLESMKVVNLREYEKLSKIPFFMIFKLLKPRN